MASDGDLTVALDVTIDDELKHEGIARELVNRIQNMRKDADLEVTDHIDLQIKKDTNNLVAKAVEANVDYIKTETLAKNLELVDRLESGTDIEFDDVATTLALQKH